MKNKALIVDLDHTLINTDLLYLSSIGVLKKRPFLLFSYLYWFMRGKGYLKEQLSKRLEIDVKNLPYNDNTIDYINTNKKKYSQIILGTASHEYYAHKVAKHLGLFDDVMASNKYFNLSSHNKAAKLVARFGVKNFDYMGDHMRDLPVWEVSDIAILVNASSKVVNRTEHLRTIIL